LYTISFNLKLNLFFSMTHFKPFQSFPLAHQQLLKIPHKQFPLFFITSSKLWKHFWHPFHPFEFWISKHLGYNKLWGQQAMAMTLWVACSAGMKNSRQTPRRRRQFFYLKFIVFTDLVSWKWAPASQLETLPQWSLPLTLNEVFL